MNKSEGWRSLLVIIIYVVLFATWLIYWLVSLYGCLPINYLLSFVPLLFALWKMTKQIPRKFIVMIAGLSFLFFVVFDSLYGTIPQQMNIAVKYNVLVVYEQWGRNLFLIGLANYVFDILLDSLVGLLLVTFIWRIIKLLHETVSQENK